MRIKINGEEFNIPSDLSEITLKQRIDFQNEHGNILQEMYDSCMKIEDEQERELELAHLSLEKVIRSISFFTGYSIEELKSSQFVDLLTNIYYNTVALLFQQEADLQVNQQYEFVWNNEIWILHVPELKNGSKMTFGEFIDSKQIIQDMLKLGKNRWECLLPLCAIFLRRKNEEYEEGFIMENSDRIELMKSLPLDIALQVGFFLSNSLTSWREIFPFSGNQEQKELVSM